MLPRTSTTTASARGWSMLVLLLSLAGCGRPADEGVIGRLQNYGCRVEVTVHDAGATMFDVTFAPGAIPDEAVPLLYQVPNLTRLSLSGTDVDDARLAQLAGLAQLEALNLRGSRISDFGLASLAELKHLALLNLTATGVTSAGLSALRPLERLELLHVARTSVDDSGLAALGEIGSLRTVTLQETRVTAQGAAGLRRSRPDLRVVR